MKTPIIIGIIAIILLPIFITNNDKNEEYNSEFEELSEQKSSQEVKVDVKGYVKSPGVYTLTTENIVDDAIKKAGGVKGGDTSCINLALEVENEQLIEVPKECSSNNIININTASKEMLMLLPNVGESRADDIINYRKHNGNFSSKEEIININGIGEKTYEKFKDKISI